MIDKTILYNRCIEKLQLQVDDLQAAIDKVQESIEGEQSSTAGNKLKQPEPWVMKN